MKELCPYDLNKNCIGRKVRFNYYLVKEGNPVIGEIISCEESSLKVRISHTLKGIKSTVQKGEVFLFHMAYIKGSVSLTKFT